MERLTDRDKANLRSMATNPEKMGVAITHRELEALVIAHDERDEMLERLTELEEIIDRDGTLCWSASGIKVATGW